MARRGPLSGVFAFLGHGYSGPGWGESYWSDFHSEPPDCWDPCDQCGNFTGGSCGTGYCQSQPRENQFAAGRYPRSANAVARPQGSPAGKGYVVRDPSSQYAPKVVSVTDRRVRPTLTEPHASVQQTAAQPRLAPAQR